MTSKGTDVNRLIDKVNASTKSPSLRKPDGSLKQFRILTNPDDKISPSIARWIEQENRIIQAALGSFWPQLEAERQLANWIVGPSRFVDLQIPDIAETPVGAAAAVLGIDQSILDHPAEYMMNLWGDYPSTIEQVIANIHGSFDQTVSSVASGILQRFEFSIGDAASEATKLFALDSVNLLDTVLGKTAIQTDINAWFNDSAALAPVLHIGDAWREQHAQFLETLRTRELWETERRRSRIQQWMTQLGSDADPATVELIEVDAGAEGTKWGNFSIAYLGVRVKGKKARTRPAHVVEIDGDKFSVWGIRITRYDTQPYLEVRNPPFGNGAPDLRNVDLFRTSHNHEMLSAIELLGHKRKRGRKSLSELWDPEAFHSLYLDAESKVRARFPGKQPNLLDISGEMGMSRRHLYRLLRRFGRPSTKRS